MCSQLLGGSAARLERGPTPGEPQGRVDAMLRMPRRFLGPAAPAKGPTRGKPLSLFGRLPRLPAPTCSLRRLRPPPSGTGPAKVPRLPPAQDAVGHAHLIHPPAQGESAIFKRPRVHRGHRPDPTVACPDPTGATTAPALDFGLQISGSLPVRRTFASPPSCSVRGHTEDRSCDQIGPDVSFVF